MIGLGRMGANMVRRLVRRGHACVVYDRSPQAVEALVKEGATGSASLSELVKKLDAPRAICLMVPAAFVDATIDELAPLLDRDDTISVGGNSHYHDDIARAKRLASRGLHYIDMGTSGGVWGLERGYCLMVGGEPAVVARLDPIFAALAPGRGDLPRTPGRDALGGTAEMGYLHCGPTGAGHFVKMIHNGIEYGLMAAYAEGLNILRHANAGAATRDQDAETTPLRSPEHYRRPGTRLAWTSADRGARAMTVDVDGIRARSRALRTHRAHDHLDREMREIVERDLETLLVALEQAVSDVKRPTEQDDDLRGSAEMWRDLYEANVTRANQAEKSVQRLRQDVPTGVRQLNEALDRIGLLTDAINEVVQYCDVCARIASGAAGAPGRAIEPCAACQRALDALKSAAELTRPNR